MISVCFRRYRTKLLNCWQNSSSEACSSVSSQHTQPITTDKCININLLSAAGRGKTQRIVSVVASSSVCISNAGTCSIKTAVIKNNPMHECSIETVNRCTDVKLYSSISLNLWTVFRSRNVLLRCQCILKVLPTLHNCLQGAVPWALLHLLSVTVSRSTYSR